MNEPQPATYVAPPPVGFKFTPRDLDVSRERQRRKLACCDIDASLWGDVADPSFFALYTIMAQRWSGRSINGNVHMSQIYRLDAGLPLDEPLAMTGEVVRIDPHPRGQVVWANFAFTDASGATPLRADRSSLNPGPGDPNAKRRDMPPVDIAEMAQIHEIALEPEKVAEFSDEAENLIHSDPETAQRFGFRAPIAGGLMASHITLGALVKEAGLGPITGLDAEIAFMRPMFWDERLRLFATPKDAPGQRKLALVGDDGKPKNLFFVDRIVFG